MNDPDLGTCPVDHPAARRTSGSGAVIPLARHAVEAPSPPSVDAKRNAMQAFCAKRPPARPPWRWHVDAGAATHHDPAGMTLAAALEMTWIHRVAGLTGDRTAWVTTRPCRAPQHTISDVGRIGGGPVPMPGDVSRAHHGMLFLDARPACRRQVLEVLRQPLEESLTRI
jgi:hypothetical protein